MAHCCKPCERSFPTYAGLLQHIDNSGAHRRAECDICDKRFASLYALFQHRESAAAHWYCNDCDLRFDNPNNLTQHLHSKTHHQYAVSCANCPAGPFATLSAWIIHAEAGTCTCPTDWRGINETMRELDPDQVFTVSPYHSQDLSENIATEHAYNHVTEKYECDMCDCSFNTLRALEQHSAGHAPNNYHCPGCPREFVKLSGLMQHIESEACGFMNFAELQEMRNLEDVADGILTCWRCL